ncbi:helix-turn-helix domain-containing protein [Streptomyces sp. ID05-04B]|uniref:helix-turn-helix domain-containing protein n=1 Tax=Streptomyces sp. ID05-04B TaxID=3028661 RepID=UPI0029C26F7C|nr:helix-turn-helix domain-containing protein [Streptomyces sp. ID05-04B]MDX5563748.1 helix-turn-helix domain-containing protein [Streptomyces sp. ID05-04B]
MNIDEMATTEQAAELLGVKVESVYLYVRRLEGFPQPTKIGRTLLFDRQALTDWRAAHPKRKRGSGES